MSKIKLGRTKSHREALIRNQMRSLFTHGSIVTTTAKAKALKQKAESFLSKMESETLETTRKKYTILGKDELVKKAMEYIKNGDSKVSIVKISFRDGDASETSKVSLVGYDKLFAKVKAEVKGKKGSKKESKRERLVDELENQKEQIEAKAKSEKKGLNLRDRFVKKERAKSRSGI